MSRGAHRPSLTYPVLPEPFTTPRLGGCTRPVCPRRSWRPEYLRPREKVRDGRSAVEAPGPAAGHAQLPGRLPGHTQGNTRAGDPRTGTMESHPTPMEARGCGPFRVRNRCQQSTCRAAFLGAGGRPRGVVSKAGPELSRREEAPLRGPSVRAVHVPRDKAAP